MQKVAEPLRLVPLPILMAMTAKLLYFHQAPLNP